MSVSLSEVIRAARARRASLAGESAGYLVLAVADQMLGAPRSLQAESVELAQDGALRVVGGVASSAEHAERCLRALLDELLMVASSGNPSLSRASRRSAHVGLEGLVRELEAALIPTNRAAARRALSRLQRETARARDDGALAPEPEPAARVQATPAPAAPTHTAPEPSNEPPLVLSPVAVPQVALPRVALASQEESERELESESPTRAIAVASVASVASVESEPVVTSAPQDESMDVDVDVSQLCDDDEVATRALPIAELAAARAALAPTQAEPSAEPEAERAEEICTRPEPVVLRASQRPPAAPVAAEPVSIVTSVTSSFEPVAAEREMFEPAMCWPAATTPTPAPLFGVACESLTPALGSLAGELPVLSADTLEELTVEDIRMRIAAHGCEPAADDVDVCTESAPNVAPLSPAVSIVPGPRSDLAELVAGFSVAGTDSSAELCRAVKEMAGIELTPAPFAALIR